MGAGLSKSSQAIAVGSSNLSIASDADPWIQFVFLPGKIPLRVQNLEEHNVELSITNFDRNP